ncbi:MAG TPA: hypothetical protein VGO75_01430, partial [Gemmatimonadaceae bacterium]|nr:hypothetical protein [Gemmatimonadaceae bacterium]
ADSSGAFTLERLPPAQYSLRAFVDRNKNHSFDVGEPWDSVSVNLTDSASATLLTFAHDTLPPRIRDLVQLDSTSLRVVFDRPVNPAQTLSAANFAVIGPDSASIPIVRVGTALKDTSQKVNPALGVVPTPAVTPQPRRDTATVTKPQMPRPSPITETVITLGRPLAPRTTYRVRAIGIRGLLGVTGDSERPITIPAPQPAPTATPSGAPPTPPPVKR